MTPILNIRGTNGSGKTHLIRWWMKKKAAVPQPQVGNLLGSQSLVHRPEYYRLIDGGTVIGDYTSSCGGCDRIRTPKEVMERIRLQLSARYVLFEGVTINTFEPWLHFSRLVGGMTWLYLDTPIEVCLKRIYQRNRGKKIDESLVASKIRLLKSQRLKAIEAGERVEVLDWRTPQKQFVRLLNSLLQG